MCPPVNTTTPANAPHNKQDKNLPNKTLTVCHNVFPNGKIAPCAFAGHDELTMIRIETGITKIGDFAFSGCNNLKSVEIPQSVEEIGDGAFSDCAELKTITIESGIKRIGDYAFSGCVNLKSIVIPESVMEIGSFVFKGCRNLESVTMPFNAKNGDKIFQYPHKVQVIQNDFNKSIPPNSAQNDYERIAAMIQERAYRWPMGNNESKNEQETVRLFSSYSIILRNSLERRLTISTEASLGSILKWGGIPKWETLCKKYSKQITALKKEKSIKTALAIGKNGSDWRIASWSKILSAYKPGEYFIYDSRVAIALSYIWLKLKKECFWQIPPFFLPEEDKKVFKEIKKAISKSKKGKKAKKMDSCYQEYIELLEKLAETKVFQESYNRLDDGIRRAYADAFSGTDDEKKKKAIMAHLEKMLFMMKEEIFNLYRFSRRFEN